MPFPQEVKTKAMVACGRSCVICHKFCGNNMEVHHIVAESEGGSNNYDNAIPLCFDCHAEVRQYDPKHPKGIRFTKDELIQHRDNWYKKISQFSPQKEEFEMDEVSPIKFYREKGYQDIKLLRVQTGADLLRYTSKVAAMEFTNDEPKTREEAKLIADFFQTIQENVDADDLFEPGDRVMVGFELNDVIKQLEDAGFWIFAAQEKRKMVGGVKKQPEDFIVLLLRVVRKTNEGIMHIKMDN
jgi:hypothetical protein